MKDNTCECKECNGTGFYYQCGDKDDKVMCACCDGTGLIKKELSNENV